MADGELQVMAEVVFTVLAPIGPYLKDIPDADLYTSANGEVRRKFEAIAEANKWTIIGTPKVTKILKPIDKPELTS